jgi:peptidoglycan/LPS O-acetylase OafA/YrhL
VHFCGTCKFIIYYFNSDLLHDYGDKISLLTIFGLDLWFIQTILAFYFLSPFFKYLIDKSSTTFIIIIIILCIFTYVIIPEIKNTITGSINRLPVFVLGMLFANGTIKWNNRIASLSYIMFFLAMMSTLLVQKNFFHFGNDLWMYPILAFGMLALLYSLLFLVNHLTLYIRNVIYSIGSHSLELYLWHEFVFSCFWLSLNKYLNYFFVLVFAFIASFFFAYLSARCVKRLLNFYFSVGMRMTK